MMEQQKEKLAFLFPGQGSQYVGMGAYLYENHAPSRELFARADAALSLPLTEIILSGPEEKLKETAITQPALLALSVATARYLQEHGVQPDVMAGHSLGEYSALVTAGSLGFAEAIRLVHLRGSLMQGAVPLGVGTMAAIMGLEDSEVDRLCERATTENVVVEPAAYNSPGQVVVAGGVAAVEKVMALAKEAGAKAIPLKVSAPFHCSMLKPAAEGLAERLQEVNFKKPQFPYVANVDASLVYEPDGIAKRLVEQVCSPVCWRQSIMTMFAMQTQRFIEVGPGKVCVGLLKKIDRRKGERAAVFALTDKEVALHEVCERFGQPTVA